MEMWHFARAFYVDAQKLRKFTIHPFGYFKERQKETELLGQQLPDHIESRSLDVGLKKAMDTLRKDGAGHVLSSGPGVILLPNDALFPTPGANFAFVWEDRGGGGAFVVPLKYSSEVNKMKRRQSMAGAPRRSLFDSAKTSKLGRGSCLP